MPCFPRPDPQYCHGLYSGLEGLLRQRRPARHPLRSYFCPVLTIVLPPPEYWNLTRSPRFITPPSLRMVPTANCSCTSVIWMKPILLRHVGVLELPLDRDVSLPHAHPVPTSLRLE